jgi:putative oxygen-independent coproporphyrinogen III oxidase
VISAPLAPPRALYLHVPFCPRICPYCDFHKMLRHEGLVAAFVRRASAEIAAAGRRWGESLTTLYLGGGTPSHLRDDELEALLAAIRAAFQGLGREETTFEADPKTFDPERLRRWREAGVTRLSIGVQSTDDAVLRFLGRGHRGDEALQALSWGLEAGFAVSADVITAVPGQDAQRDLRAVAASGVGHVSVYTLTIEAHTSFARRGVEVDDDRAADDFDAAEAILAAHGFERYEVSNHARRGERSRHNPVYWRGEACIAIGPSAAGLEPARRDDPPGTVAVRVRNPDLKGYLRGDPPERIALSGEAFALELLMTGLRTREGVDLAVIAQRTGIDVEAAFPQALALAFRHDLLRGGGRLVATPRGVRVLNAVLREFFAEAAQRA